MSPTGKAQRQGDIQSMTRLLELMTPLSQLDPGIMDYVDSDGISKHLIKILGVPATAIRGDREVAIIRAQRQEQQAQAAEQAELMQSAEAAGNAAPDSELWVWDKSNDPGRGDGPLQSRLFYRGRTGVLEDMGVRFCEHSSTFSSDPCETAYREGQRTVLLFIRSMIRDRKPLEDIAEDE